MERTRDQAARSFAAKRSMHLTNHPLANLEGRSMQLEPSDCDKTFADSACLVCQPSCLTHGALYLWALMQAPKVEA
jgi:hypothetical protein